MSTEIERQPGEADFSDPDPFPLVEGHVGLPPAELAVADQQRLVRADRQVCPQIKLPPEGACIDLVVVRLVGAHIDVQQLGRQIERKGVEQESAFDGNDFVKVRFQREGQGHRCFCIEREVPEVEVDRPCDRAEPCFRRVVGKEENPVAKLHRVDPQVQGQALLSRLLFAGWRRGSAVRCHACMVPCPVAVPVQLNFEIVNPQGGEMQAFFERL